MDMDNELDDFDKTGTPSLLGQSIRGEPRPNSTTTDSRSSSKPNFKVSRSPEESVTSLEQLQQEGVLLQDEENLDDILDKEGHIKDAALDINEKENTKNGDELKPPSSIDIKTINEQEENDSFISNDQEFIAPASSRDGSISRSSSAQPSFLKHNRDSTKPSKRSPLTENTINSVDKLLDNDNATDDAVAPSITDIVNEYNEGNYEIGEDKKEENVVEERQPRKITRNFEDPQIPDSAIDIDSQFTVPAGAKEGTDSPYISSPSKSITSNSNGEYVKSPERPHLARGDSYQNTVTNNDFNNTPALNIGERGSRTSTRSESSLNYLRSISRSRSRVANDRNAMGENRGIDENLLKEEGALVGDHYDQLPDLEDAVERALDLVQEELKSLMYDHDDIPEEEEGEEENAKSMKVDPVTSNDNAVDKSEEKVETLENEPIKPVSKFNEVSTPETEVATVDSTKEKDDCSSRQENETVSKEIDSLQDTKEEEEKSEEKISEEDISENKEKLPTEESLTEVENNLSTEEEPLTVLETEKIPASIEPSVELDQEETPTSDEISNVIEKEQDKDLNTDEILDKLEKEELTTSEEVLSSKELKSDTELPVEELDGKDIASQESTADQELKPAEEGEEKESKPVDLTKEEEEKESKKIEVSIEEENNDSKPEEASIKKEEENDDSKPVEVSKEEEDSKLVKLSKEEEESEEETKVESKAPPASKGADGSVFVPKESDKMTYEDEPVYLFTSFAGGNQIATRTNRMITILMANKIEYTLRDLGTDVEAKKIWRRYSSGKTLPGIVRGKDDFIGNWEEIEEANENYEVRSLIYETA